MAHTPRVRSRRSERLLEVARSLTELWPDEVRADAGVAGSVARGTADESSDVELSFWLDGPLSEEWIDGWLRGAGAEPISSPPFSTAWPTFRQFRWQGEWFDAGWHSAKDHDAELRESLGDLRRSPLEPGIMQTLIPLRSTGQIEAWKALTMAFPEPLAESFITHWAGFWAMPHWVDARWAFARRSQRMALAGFLRMDVQAILSVLSGLNRTWPQDVKWIHDVCASFDLCPPRLADRIEGIFAPVDGFEAVAQTYVLVLETLALLGNRPVAVTAYRVVAESVASAANHRPGPG